jgi:hypothetical protein
LAEEAESSNGGNRDKGENERVLDEPLAAVVAQIKDGLLKH